MVRLIFDEPECTGLVDAIFSLINVNRIEGNLDVNQQVTNRYGAVFVECTKLFKMYDRDVWNVKSFEQMMQENY